MKKTLFLVTIILTLYSCSKSDVEPILSNSNTITNNGHKFAPSVLKPGEVIMIFTECRT